MHHYTIRARNEAGPLALLEPLSVGQAIHKVIELRDQGFEDITLMIVETGVEITDLERFIKDHRL